MVVILTPIVLMVVGIPGYVHIFFIDSFGLFKKSMPKDVYSSAMSLGQNPCIAVWGCKSKVFRAVITSHSSSMFH